MTPGAISAQTDECEPGDIKCFAERLERTDLAPAEDEAQSVGAPLAGAIIGAVGAIATGFALYKLRTSKPAEPQQSEADRQAEALKKALSIEQ